MTGHLALGFRERPKELQSVMESQGFAFEGFIEPDSTFPLRIESYTFFDEPRSTIGVRFSYHEETYFDHAEDWRHIVDDPSTIVATGSVTTYVAKSSHVEAKQMQTAKFLRDHYNAVLYDPKSDQIIAD